MKQSSGSPLTGWNPSSGGRKSSSAARRSPVPAGQKTPDRWDLSQSTAASTGSKSLAANWGVVKIVRSIGSCFGRPVTGSPKAKSWKSFTSPPCNLSSFLLSPKPSFAIEFGLFRFFFFSRGSNTYFMRVSGPSPCLVFNVLYFGKLNAIILLKLSVYYWISL